MGTIGFMGGFAISMKNFNYNKELPIGNPEGIVVSPDGRIYIGLQFYGKIQSYDNNGGFIKNWSVDNNGGAFSIHMLGDIIYVNATRVEKSVYYDLDGNELNDNVLIDISTKFEDPNEYVQVLLAQNSKEYKRDSITYKINTGLFPTVSKIERGQCDKIITIPFLLKLIKGPMPAWLFLAFGILIRLFIYKMDFQ